MARSILTLTLAFLAVHPAGATSSWDQFDTLEELFGAGDATALSDATLYKLDGLLTDCADAATSHAAFVTCAVAALARMRADGELSRRDVRVVKGAVAASSIGKSVAEILMEASGIVIDGATEAAIDACERRARDRNSASTLEACVTKAVKGRLSNSRTKQFMTAYTENEVEIEDEVEDSADEIEDETEDNDDLEDGDNDGIEDEDNDDIEDEDNDEVEDEDDDSVEDEDNDEVEDEGS